MTRYGPGAAVMMRETVAVMPQGRQRTHLTAAASRLAGERVGTGLLRASDSGWQADAWEMYDAVGEERFLANTIAGRLGQARLYVAHDGEALADDVVEVRDSGIESLLDSIGDSHVTRTQMLHRLAVNLFVAGEGWLVGVPPALLPASLGGASGAPGARGAEGALGLEDVPLDALVWRVLSVSEVSSSAGEVVLSLGDDDEPVRCAPDDVYLIRVWRPHPRRWREADSSTKACLPILRELAGLTMHVSAQVDSRLAGAGLLVVPQSASDAIRRSAGVDMDDEEDPFVDALIQSMVTPIAERDSASAVVPLVATVPDEAAGLFTHLTFSSGLDEKAQVLRDESIRRLALAQDAPPELLLGTAGMNHWGAWLVREETVTTHIEPPLALICEALTTQFLWPVLESLGLSTEDARRFSVAYDVSHLVARPNRAEEALALHRAGVVSDRTLREASGFDDSDAPVVDVRERALKVALEAVAQTPSLLSEPGLPALVDGIVAVLEASGPVAAVDAQAGVPAPSSPGQPDGVSSASPVGSSAEAPKGA